MVYKQFCGGLESMEKDSFNCYSRLNVADW
jgi:hypothetical protein